MKNLIRLILLSTTILVSDNVLADNNDEKIYFKAGKIDYDDKNSIVKASDNVILATDDRIVIADKIIFDEKNNRLQLSGNVSLLEPDGSVFFASEIEADTAIKLAFAENFGARMKNEAIIAANKAAKVDENTIQLDKAVYTACPICKLGEKIRPQWQVKAKKVLIDDKEEVMTYNHAFFEIYEIPIFYTPYLRHPSPKAKRKSGFLQPSYGRIGSVGNYVKIPFYYNIAPDKDATFTLMPTTNEGLVLFTEFRHLMNNGRYEVKGSITNPDDYRYPGQDVGKKLRGHIETTGQFSHKNDWVSGFTINRASDDTYLKRYKLRDDNYLTSRIYAEQIQDRNYNEVQTIFFQGLTQNSSGSSTPFIFPSTYSHYETDKNYGNGRFTMDLNSMILMRDEGVNSRRLSIQGGWHRSIINRYGLVSKFSSHLRGDGYAVTNVADPAYPNDPQKNFDGTTGRVIPEAELDLSYPLINQNGLGYLIFEPTVNLIVSPYGGNPYQIPDEDSSASEISDYNLFSANRFTGYDRVENGPRVNYGIRTYLKSQNDFSANALFGQAYHSKSDKNFSANSGFDSKFSDYVGRLSVSPFKYIDVSYRFRLDKERMSFRKKEIGTRFTKDKFSTSVNYLELSNKEIDSNMSSTDKNRSEIWADVSYRFTDSWSSGLFARKRLTHSDKKMLSNGGHISYHSECVDIIASVAKDYTKDRDVAPQLSYNIWFSLKSF